MTAPDILAEDFGHKPDLRAPPRLMTTTPRFVKKNWAAPIAGSRQMGTKREQEGSPFGDVLSERWSFRVRSGRQSADTARKDECSLEDESCIVLAVAYRVTTKKADTEVPTFSYSPRALGAPTFSGSLST